MGRYRKKPVEVDAFRLGEEWPDWWADKVSSNDVLVHNLDGRFGDDPAYAAIRTLEGVMRANVGDWIIRGVAGEIYPCKPDIFERTYERCPTKSDLPPSMASDGPPRPRGPFTHTPYG